MKKGFAFLGVVMIVFLIVSTSTAIPQIQSSKIGDLIEKKNNIVLFKEKLNINSSFFEFLLKILYFLQNLCTKILTIFTPLMNPLQRIADFLENLLGRLEPWEDLGVAILNLIDAINYLIEAINNLIDDGEKSYYALTRLEIL